MIDANERVLDLEISINAAFIRSRLFETDHLMSYRFKTGIDLVRYVTGRLVRNPVSRAVFCAIDKAEVMQQLIWLCDAIVSHRLDSGSETC